MKAAIVKEDGLIYVNEVPEEPEYNGEIGHSINVQKQYYEQLEVAKKNAVLCADQEKARELVMRKSSMGKDKDGFYQPTVGVHPIPDLQWEVKEELEYPIDHTSYPPYRKVAILKESIPSKSERKRLLIEMMKEDEPEVKCLCCGKRLTTRQQKEVGLCLPCFIKKYGDDEEE